MKKHVKALKTAGNVLLWVFLAFSVCITILVFTMKSNDTHTPEIGNYYMLNILTPSMDPTIKPGDLIISKKLEDADKQNLKKDDIITFYTTEIAEDGTPVLNTHRIDEVNYISGKVVSFKTKGDNKVTNPDADASPVMVNSVVGKYTNIRIVLLGWLLEFIKTEAGFYSVIFVPLIAVFIYELVKFIIACTALKGKTKLSAADEELIKQKAIEEYLRSQQESNEAAEKEDNGDRDN